MKKNSEETRLINSIMQYSMYKADKMDFTRTNTGAIKFKRPDDSDAFIKFGKKGMADITGIIYPGIYISIECKVQKNKLTAHQANFGNIITKLGGIYLEIRDLDTFIKITDDLMYRFKDFKPLNEGFYGEKKHLV